eukprot:4830366-Prymnesium_polylepis.1
MSVRSSLRLRSSLMILITRATGLDMSTQDKSDVCGAFNGTLSSDGGVCCGIECGRCGGRSCQLRPGGSASCCTSSILAARLDCRNGEFSEQRAPCIRRASSAAYVERGRTRARIVHPSSAWHATYKCNRFAKLLGIFHWASCNTAAYESYISRVANAFPTFEHEQLQMPAHNRVLIFGTSYMKQIALELICASSAVSPPVLTRNEHCKRVSRHHVEIMELHDELRNTSLLS